MLFQRASTINIILECWSSIKRTSTCPLRDIAEILLNINLEKKTDF